MADGDCICGNGEAEEDRAAVLRCPVHRQVCTDEVWPDESGVESGSLAGYREAVPADGEQPAGSTDLHELDLERRGIIPPSPSDGPVSDGEEENQHDGNQGLDEWVTKRND